MRLLTINLNYYVDKHGAWEDRKREIIAVLRQKRPDVVLLQAVAADDQWDGGRDQGQQLCDAVPELVSHFFAEAQTVPGGQRQGNAILASHRIEENAVHALTLLPGLDDGNQRVLIRSRFRTSVGILEIYTAHFSWVQDQSQMNSREAVDFIREGRGLAILGGDLNTHPTSDALSPLREHGMIDAWQATHANRSGYTFESPKPSMRIDYFWLTAGLADRIRRIETVAVPAGSHTELSDHFGLFLELGDITLP